MPNESPAPCADCGLPNAYAVSVSDPQVAAITEMMLCDTCANDRPECEWCEEILAQTWRREILNGDDYVFMIICYYCATSSSFRNCDVCGYLAQIDSYNFREECCNSCVGSDGTEEDDYFDEALSTGAIQSWNYRPSRFNFHPTNKLPNPNGLFMGMELEVSFSRGRIDEIANDWWAKQDHDLIYIKSDSTIESGWEIVTHPFQPDWGLEHFPFDEIEELIDEYGAHASHQSCGTHVHLNKNAFTDAHLWKLFQIHGRLDNFIGMIGGRGPDNQWGRFSTVQNMCEGGLGFIRSLKDGGNENYERYSAINAQNTDTLELRYPEGGIEQRTIRKNIEWIQALFDFTNELTLSDVKEGVIDDPGYLLGWIAARNDTLPYLNEHIKKSIPAPIAMPEREI